MPSLTGNSFNPDTDIPDLAGKTYLVTGGSAGIGFGIIAHLIQHHAQVLLLSNKEEHVNEAIEELKNWGKQSQVEWIKCNLANLKQTDQVASDILKRDLSLNGMIMNAGIGFGKYWETIDGLDRHSQINWLSQFHLVLRLMPLLKKTPGSRLIFMSSDLHRAPDADAQFKDEQEINTDIGPLKLYDRSKLAQVLGVLTIQRRFESGDTSIGASANDKIFVNATHPGAVSTDQQEQLVEAYGTLEKVGVAAFRPLLSDPVKTGCRSALFAATSPEIEKQGITGKYIVPDKKVTSPSSKAQDVELGEQLWRLSQDLIKKKLSSV